LRQPGWKVAAKLIADIAAFVYDVLSLNLLQVISAAKR